MAQARDHPDDLVTTGLWCPPHSHLGAMPQDADPVGQPKHLVERVTDEQDSPARVAQPPDEDELLDALRLGYAHRCGRLIHQHQPLRPVSRPGDRDPLALATRQLADRLPRVVDVDVELLQ
jgi:hypothetical protein